MYASVNFRTKKALKEAIAEGKRIEAYSPGPFPCPRDGSITLEGPWYPEPHRWYAQATIRDGIITSVK